MQSTNELGKIGFRELYVTLRRNILLIFVCLLLGVMYSIYTLKFKNSIYETSIILLHKTTKKHFIDETVSLLQRQKELNNDILKIQTEQYIIKVLEKNNQFVKYKKKDFFGQKEIDKVLVPFHFILLEKSNIINDKKFIVSFKDSQLYIDKIKYNEGDTLYLYDSKLVISKNNSFNFSLVRDFNYFITFPNSKFLVNEIKKNISIKKDDEINNVITISLKGINNDDNKRIIKDLIINYIQEEKEKQIKKKTDELNKVLINELENLNVVSNQLYSTLSKSQTSIIDTNHSKLIEKRHIGYIKQLNSQNLKLYDYDMKRESLKNKKLTLSDNRSTGSKLFNNQLNNLASYQQLTAFYSQYTTLINPLLIKLNKQEELKSSQIDTSLKMAQNAINIINQNFKNEIRIIERNMQIFYTNQIQLEKLKGYLTIYQNIYNSLNETYLQLSIINQQIDDNYMILDENLQNKKLFPIAKSIFTSYVSLSLFIGLFLSIFFGYYSQNIFDKDLIAKYTGLPVLGDLRKRNETSMIIEKLNFLAKTNPCFLVNTYSKSNAIKHFFSFANFLTFKDFKVKLNFDKSLEKSIYLTNFGSKTKIKNFNVSFEIDSQTPQPYLIQNFDKSIIQLIFSDFDKNTLKEQEFFDFDLIVIHLVDYKTINSKSIKKIINLSLAKNNYLLFV